MSEVLVHEVETSEPETDRTDSVLFAGKVTVLEALAEKIDVVSPNMTWQTAWSGRDDK